jgi:N-acetylneuraminic acid mutarotase
MKIPIRPRLASAAVLFLSALAASTEKAVARDLTFEDRVKAQGAIERVYDSHQVGATRPFAEAVPRARLESKLRTYLKQTAALERFWRTSVTAEMLSQELRRMVASTRMPDRLRELEAALGDDPFLIQETLARPALVDRLARNFFASDATIHGKERREAEALREELTQGRLDPRSEHPRRTLVEVVRVDPVAGTEGVDARALGGGRIDSSRLELQPDAFDQVLTMMPYGRGEVGQVQDEREAFAIRVLLTMKEKIKKEDTLRVATFVVRKLPWDEWWASVESDLQEASVEAVARADVSLPTLPSDRPEVFSSTCPGDDTWDNRTLDGLPGPRSNHTAVWTGSVMVVWGGGEYGLALNTGSRYDPATDTWTAMSTINAPQARYFHTAVWTGSLMVVWGGHSGINLSENLGGGGRYDPAADTWTSISTANAPSARFGHSAVWTGSQMVLWGGYIYDQQLHGFVFADSGGRYDPATDTWTSTSLTNAPSARYAATAVWTGSRMIVWGGFGSNAGLSTGGRYDPATDPWTSMSGIDTPSARSGYSSVWAGNRMVVWGGVESLGEDLNTGGRYDPVTDAWTSTSTTNAPSARHGQTAVSTGSQMIVWGGRLGLDYFWGDNSGGRYDPSTDSWTPMSSLNEPSFYGQGAWTGRELIVLSSRGGRYTPSASAAFYRDLDGDGHGDPHDSITACAQSAGYATAADDCDDGDPSIHPGAAEDCNDRDDYCTGGIDDGPGASASCDDGDACTNDACQSGTCVRTEAIIPRAVCTAEPAALNLDSKGRAFGATIILTNQCPGQSLDPEMLAPLYLAGLASPSLGTVLLPAPDSGPECTQDGVWETASARVPLAAGSMKVHFLAHSDGLCSTLDGNRQDILALLRDVPDREQAQIHFTSSYPGVVIPVTCGATVTILSHQ